MAESISDPSFCNTNAWRNISAPSRPNRDSKQGTRLPERSAERAPLGTEGVTDFKEVVEPLVQQHVEPPSSIELGAAALGQLAQLDVAMSLAATHGFDEPRIVVNAHDEVRVRSRDARIVEPVREAQRRRVRLTAHDVGVKILVARRRGDDG